MIDTPDAPTVASIPMIDGIPLTPKPVTTIGMASMAPAATVAEERLRRKQKLAGALRIFGRFGFGEGVAGHITVRDPEFPDHFWVNPLGLSFRHMRVSDLILVNHHGEVVYGQHSVNRAAYVLHAAVHAARPDVMAAAHAHSVYGKAFSALGVPLDPLTQDSCAFYEQNVVIADHGGAVVFEVEAGPYATSENALAARLLPLLQPGMLCMADRGFFSYGMWQRAIPSGADLLWRLKADAILPCLERLHDGSFLSKLYPSVAARSRDKEGIAVRVVEYSLDGLEDPEQVYRLVTTILDPGAAPAEDLARLYHDRWEIETAFDELKTHLRGRQAVLRSKTADLVMQEFYGLLLAHYAVRGLMHEAALKADLDPDRISFVHSIRVIRRNVMGAGSFPPSASPS